MNASSPPRVVRFACTSCGACCDRSPEVQLSEAAGLADRFVFRLMFRLYEMPRTFPGASSCRGSAESFYESKRLLAAFAARSYPARKIKGTDERTLFLTISALPLDTSPGACAALKDRRCGLYERRPLACRSVPFHYSRPEASAETDLAAFVARPSFACDTGAGAPVVLAGGRIVDPGALTARSEALEVAERDRHWQDSIARRVRTGRGTLPSLREIEANAAFGTTTVPMAAAWRIAADDGLIGDEECRSLIAAQAALVRDVLAQSNCTPDTRQTLIDMSADYARLLND